MPSLSRNIKTINYLLLKFKLLNVVINTKYIAQAGVRIPNTKYYSSFALATPISQNGHHSRPSGCLNNTSTNLKRSVSQFINYNIDEYKPAL